MSFIVLPDGTTTPRESKEIANQLGFNDFKASNGWFDRWKKQNNIKRMTISGESRKE